MTITVQEIVKRLQARAKSDQLEGMARYGMAKEMRLGISIPDLRKLAREIGKDHKLALALWKTGFQEARILAAMVDVAEEVTSEQMDAWVEEINSWDVCDQVCMNLFERVPLALKKIDDWSKREEEFVKRIAFSLIACLAWHDKEAPDETFIRFLSIIKQGSTDERNFVKKAVNWALRNIGKRNPRLNRTAIAAAKDIKQMDSKPARWIASDAIRELESDAVQRRLKQL